MSSENNEKHETPPQDFIKHSNLYQEFLAEREEIMRHKWLESENLGYDIGFERALLDWIRKHREGWRLARRQQQKNMSSSSSQSDSQSQQKH